jgi:CHASE2 domain-containing sensor protein
MTQLLIQYTYLQLLDFMTTVAFLVNGVAEGNPLVRFVLGVAPNPLGGLLAVKAAAMILGFYCWRMRRDRTLMRINIMFAVLVAWNLVALILGGLHPR